MAHKRGFMHNTPRWLEKGSVCALLCSTLVLVSPALAAPVAHKKPAAKPSTKVATKATPKPATQAKAPAQQAAAPSTDSGSEQTPAASISQDVPDPTTVPSDQATTGPNGEMHLPAPPKPKLLPGGIHPGPMLKWRQQLHAQITEAGKRGVGVTNYKTAFDDLEKMVENGAPEADIRSKIIAILTPLHQQMRSGMYLKQFTPEKPPPESPPLLAPAGEAEKAFRLTQVQVPVSQLEQSMFSYLNQDRSANGLPPLSFSSSLAGVARDHSEDMCKRKFFAHVNLDGVDPQGRARNHGISVPVAENIALVSDRGNPKAMIQQAEINLMNSPGHRANILNTGYRCVGIGVGYDASGSIRVTQLFSPESI